MLGDNFEKFFLKVTQGILIGEPACNLMSLIVLYVHRDQLILDKVSKCNMVTKLSKGPLLFLIRLLLSA